MGNVETYDNRAAWLAARRSGIGSSDAAAILGQTTWGSPYSVWAEKAHGIGKDVGDSEYVRWGSVLEGPIRDEYQQRTGRRVSHAGSFAITRHPDIPWLAASLDGTVEPGSGDVVIQGVYEGKTAGGHKAEEWANEPPLAYQIQVQHQMAATGLQWASIACLIGGQKLVYFDVERNQRFIDAMLEKLAAFWRCVETKTPPDVDASAATRSALKLLHPLDNGQTVELPESAAARWIERQLISDEIKSLEARRDEIDHWFKAAIGDNTYATCGGETWSLKTSTRKSYTVKESTVRTLRKVGTRE